MECDGIIKIDDFGVAIFSFSGWTTHLRFYRRKNLKSEYAIEGSSIQSN